VMVDNRIDAHEQRKRKQIEVRKLDREGEEEPDALKTKEGRSDQIEVKRRQRHLRCKLRPIQVIEDLSETLIDLQQ
jgi:hypothetical protein